MVLDSEQDEKTSRKILRDHLLCVKYSTKIEKPQKTCPNTALNVFTLFLDTNVHQPFAVIVKIHAAVLKLDLKLSFFNHHLFKILLQLVELGFVHFTCPAWGSTLGFQLRTRSKSEVRKVF